MDLPAPPVMSAFDAVTSGLAAAVYLAVASLTLARAPGDARARVFFVVAITSAPAYLAQVLAWRYGSTAALTRGWVLLLAVSMTASGVALFHFAQVFPWDRPWIRKYRAWLIPAYVVPAAIMLGLAWFSPVNLDGITIPYLLAAVAFGAPAILLAGIVLPIAGVLSLYKTWLAARRHAIERARLPALGVLISQLAGGLLAVLIVPLLHVVAPTGPWVTLTAGALFACGILMPIAVAIGVFSYDVLSLDPKEPPEGL